MGVSCKIVMWYKQESGIKSQIRLAMILLDGGARLCIISINVYIYFVPTFRINGEKGASIAIGSGKEDVRN